MPSSKSPFDALEKLRDRLPVGTPAQNETKPVAPEPAPPSGGPRPQGSARPQDAAAPKIKSASGGPARAVVRLERKQRRGKEVTVVEKLGLKMSELEAWCKQLKQAMGCGGTIEGDAIVLQGDLRTRLPDVLTKLGVRNVTVSG
jgi:translation initiation factor 1